jgi:hypothetical protein
LDQFHCVYDDLFSSINSPEGNPFEIDRFSDQHWNRLIKSGYERHAEPKMDAAGNPIPFPEITDDWLSGPERHLWKQICHERCEKRVRLNNQQRNPPEPMLPHIQREHQPPGITLPHVKREREQHELPTKFQNFHQLKKPKQSMKMTMEFLLEDGIGQLTRRLK